MAEEAAPDTTTVIVEKPPLWQRTVKWVAIVVLAIVVLLGLLLVGLNTSPGRRFVADRIAGYTTASGLNIQIGRIEGSIYGAMVLKDVRVRDTQGVFASSPEIDVDWRPFEYLHNHIDIRSATSKLITLYRKPALKATPSQPNQPLLPNIDIDVNRLKVDRLVMGAPVTGTKRVLTLAGQAHIANRRAQIVVDAAALNGPGVIGGDRLALKLDAVPDDNKLDIDARLFSPAKGIVAGLSGVTKPLAVTIVGNGSWKAWNGHATGTLGGQSLVDLALTAHNGTFSIRGNAHPGLYMAGPVARLTAPRLDIAIDATLDHRTANTRMVLHSSALAVNAQGLIDLANNHFGNFRIDARLLTPGAVAPKLAASNAAIHLALDGPFATPTVGYVVAADAISFGGTGVDKLYATGRATVNADRILIPVNARAARVTGISAAGGLLENVSINGNLAIKGPQILSTDLKLKSDRIDATAIIAANVSTGRYTGALKGRINNYRIDSIGIINLQTDANLTAGAKGGWGIKGRIVARTSQIFNSGVRSFLGGNAVVSTDIGYDTSGVITFSNLHLAAPQFHITSGSGRYDPSGRLLVNANATSSKYGPLTVRVTGSPSAPDVLLRAPRPGLGVGLANLEAHVRGTRGAYAVTATGDTNYGPFTADVQVRPGAQLRVDVNRLLFAGVVAHGSVAKTAAGPFAGTLDFAGSGLTGTVRLAAQQGVQRADIAAHAYNAKFPGKVEFTIGRAIINASAILYPNAPSITADVQVANLAYGPTVISKARIKVGERGGKGTAQLVASGSNGVPFNLAANAQLGAGQYLVALQGNAAGVNFRTASPMHIVKSAGGYQLAPARIEFDRGSLRLAGRYGPGLSLQVRLDRLDLAIVNAFVPGLDIGGIATGSVDLTQPAGGGIPNAEALINIDNFTRSSISTVSEPVDVVLKATLNGTGAQARALIRTGNIAIGRLVANLQPLGPGASWTARLAHAPLSGGIRYNGPAAVLFSLSGLSRQTLTGPIAVGADFSGRLSAPQINGVVRADNLTYENETFGTRLTNLALQGRFTNDRFELASLSAKAGDGTIKAEGNVGLSAEAGFPINLTATFDNAQLARSDDLSATTTGQLKIVHDKSGGTISGHLTIPSARYQIIRQGQAEVPELTGVHRKGQPTAEQQRQQKQAQSLGLFKLDIRLSADNQLFVQGMGLDSEWKASLRIRGTTAAPVVTGSATVVRGTYSFAGKRFTLNRGVVRFEGGALSDPVLDISASTTTNGITAVINITGTGQHPQIEFTSDPALPQDEVLSRLLFGSDPSNLSAIQAIQLASALNSLRGSGGGLNPLGKLRSATGIDRLEILGADQATGRGTAVAAGKYITNDIYVQIITDARGYTATQLEISLTKALSLLTEAGTFGGSSASIQYKKDY